MPKPLSGNMLIKEIRITPYDQEPLTLESIKSDLHVFDKVILCEEGTPNGSPQLHYHGYIETKKSMTFVREILKRWAHSPNQKINGNKLYFTKDPHENTMGYIVKNGKVVVNHGYTQSQIDEYITQSKDYVDSKKEKRAKEKREREDELREIYDIVKTDLQTGVTYANPYQIIQQILDLCDEKNIRYPTRNQTDYWVIQLMRPYDKSIASDFYLKSFSQH